MASTVAKAVIGSKIKSITEDVEGKCVYITVLSRKYAHPFCTVLRGTIEKAMGVYTRVTQFYLIIGPPHANYSYGSRRCATTVRKKNMHVQCRSPPRNHHNVLVLFRWRNSRIACNITGHRHHSEIRVSTLLRASRLIFRNTNCMCRQPQVHHKVEDFMCVLTIWRDVYRYTPLLARVIEHVYYILYILKCCSWWILSQTERYIIFVTRSGKTLHTGFSRESQSQYTCISTVPH